MGIIENYFKSCNQSSMAKFFEEAKRNKDAITLWQPQNENRIITEAVIQAVVREKNSLILSGMDGLKLTSDFSQFQHDRDLYLKDKMNNWVSKTTISKFSPMLMVLNYPDTLFSIEKRKFHRINLLDKLETFEIIFTHCSGKGARKTLRFPLLDISYGGVGIFLPKKFLHYFYPGDRLFIESISGRDFSQSLPAHLVSLGRMGASSSKMGVRFDSVCDEGLIKSFL